MALPLGGIAGALAATVLVHGIAGRGAGTMSLILAGVALSSLCGARPPSCSTSRPIPMPPWRSSSG
jgi:iron complex transport system permease protein